MWWHMENEKRDERWAGKYSCGCEKGYGAAMNALAQTKVNTYRTSSIPMADFWRPENLPAIGRVFERWLPELDVAAAEKAFEFPTAPVCNGKPVGDPSMTDLMIIGGQYQVAIEGKYTEYAWGPCETLDEWLCKKQGRHGSARRRRIANAWRDMIGRAGCTDLHSEAEFFARCGEVGYQFLHRAASACNGTRAGVGRLPVLVYQLFYDRDDHAQIAARNAFKASLRRWAGLLKLTKMRFLVLEVPVTNGKRIESRTGELDERFARQRANIFKTLPGERIYDFDFDGISAENMFCRNRGEMTLADVKSALAAGGKATLLMRHAARPPIADNDPTFGASLSLTPRGWTAARQFGAMLADVVRPKSVAFYASETFRTVQTACGMAMGLDAAKSAQPIERKIGLADFLGGESPFFGALEDRMALIAEGRYHERLNEYFRMRRLRGYRPLGKATGEMEAQLGTLHKSGDSIVVAVTHDINVAAFLAGQGVVSSFTDKTWPDYLDAAVILQDGSGRREYGFVRGTFAMGAAGGWQSNPSG